MSLTKRTLVLTTALTLSMGPAWADGNKAVLDQNGLGNNASIDQSNAVNSRAGNDANNRFVLPTDRMLADGLDGTQRMQQNGDDNTLSISQSGFGNSVGARSGSNGGNGFGLKQEGNNNATTIEQSGIGNYVNSIVQQADETGTETVNTLEVTQTGTALTAREETKKTDNFITGVQQTNTSDGDDAALGNTITITQKRDTDARAWRTNAIGRGPLGSTLGNDAKFGQISILQNGDTNVMTITQVGEANRINDGSSREIELQQLGSSNEMTVEQRGVGNGLASVIQDSTGTVGNSATVKQIGNDNGRSAFTASSFAAEVGVVQGTVSQTGDNNDVYYSATGNNNLLGFLQNGNGNSVGMVMITGSNNETAGSQVGDGNTINMNPIVGSDNNVGVLQDSTGYPSGNTANISLDDTTDFSADGNLVGVSQTGTNLADVEIDGDNNFVDISQTLNNSGAKGVYVNIVGNSNGTIGFTDDAFEVADGVLAVGEIVQDGMDNLFDMDITGDSNSFAALQDGNTNTIVALVDGSFNQFAITQVGSMNISNLTQDGQHNNAGISQ